MAKLETINEIKEKLKSFNNIGYYPCNNGLTFHFQSCEYYLMAFIIEDNDELIIECIGYNDFRLFYFKAEEFSFRTLHKFKTFLEKF